ncbi:MAG TPA: hypothetical protein VHW01_06120 [Polyangiaceae bacterium]|jgi:hypothetical protein|nr:hypothetical protein [Polyangiaceae bacterium]
MVTLNLEHGIGSLEVWQAAFDRDPAQRERSGVRRYRASQPVGDSKQVIIDLDFDDVEAAQAFLESLRQVWAKAELSPGLLREPGGAASSPRARILEQVKSHQY